MRFCGSVDIMPSYERINLLHDGSQPSTPSPRTVKLGGKNGDGNPLWIGHQRVKSSDVKRKLASDSSSSFKAKGSESWRKIGFVDIISSYKALLQPPGVQKEELSPTIGFIQDP